MQMSVPVVTWQWHCCHLVPPAEMPPPHTAAAATAKAPLQQPFCPLHPNEFSASEKLTLLTQSSQRKSVTFKCLLGSICIILVFVWVHQYWELQEKGYCYQEHGKRWRAFQRFLREGKQEQSKEITFICTWINQLTPCRSVCQYKLIEQTILVTNRLSKKSCSLWWEEQFNTPQLIWTPWSPKDLYPWSWQETNIKRSSSTKVSQEVL